MKKIKLALIAITSIIIIQGCSGVKVLTAWKAEPAILNSFKEKNVLVIARTSNTQARLAFEQGIAGELRARGIKCTESYSKAPNIKPNREVTEEHQAMIRSLIESEGFTAIVLTVVKDKQKTETTSTNGVYMGVSAYPGYYGGFYNYYSYPYAYGSYYDSFGGYVGGSTSTYVTTDYVLETVAYNLEKDEADQLVAVVTTSLDNPKEAYKTSEKYVEEIFASLEKVNN